MATYSFLNVSALVAGPGLAANIGSGAGVEEEGITITPVEDKNVMTIGVDGVGQHALVASNACTLKVRLLKTSPYNALLMAAFDLQSASSALWGLNTITVTDSARGDLSIVQEVAFKKKPEINYDKPGKMIEWEFDGIQANSILGAGI